MVRRDGAEARKERIEKIARSINASIFANKDADYIPLKKRAQSLTQLHASVGIHSSQLSSVSLMASPSFSRNLLSQKTVLG